MDAWSLERRCVAFACRISLDPFRGGLALAPVDPTLAQRVEGKVACVRTMFWRVESTARVTQPLTRLKYGTMAAMTASPECDGAARKALLFMARIHQCDRRRAPHAG